MFNPDGVYVLFEEGFTDTGGGDRSPAIVHCAPAPWDRKIRIILRARDQDGATDG